MKILPAGTLAGYVAARRRDTHESVYSRYRPSSVDDGRRCGAGAGGDAAVLRPIEAEDFGAAVVEFKSGAVVSLRECGCVSEEPE
jgi:hypothetical protein